MNPVREALMNALGLCETILAMREEMPADVVEGAELVREQLMTAAQLLKSRARMTSAPEPISPTRLIGEGLWQSPRWRLREARYRLAHRIFVLRTRFTTL